MSENELKNIMENLVFNEKGPEKLMIQANNFVKILRICLKKGLKVPPHDDDHYAFFIVYKGKGIFTKGTKRIQLQQNDFIYIEANEVRGFEALEDLVVLAINK
jgi:quercetin dioxygenase-like cupin family protein